MTIASRGSSRRPPGHTAPKAAGISRGALLVALGTALRQHGASPQATRAALREENAARCAPPLTASEIGAVYATSERASRVGERAAGTIAPQLIAIDASDLLAKAVPQLAPLLSPWLREKSLAMVHAWRGLGKTQFALSTALAVSAGGSFLGWHAPRPQKVLYLDGELPARIVQERLRLLMQALGVTPSAGMLRFVTPDFLEGPVPDIASAAGQAMVDALVEPDTALIVVDSLSCLARGSGEENEAASWITIADWALKHRRAGRALLFVHHSGKTGKQRGTSRREDLLDVSIGLHRPPDYSESQGTRFEVRFEKARSLYGADVEPVEALLSADGEHPRWTTRKVVAAGRERVAALWEAGLAISDIAREADLAKSTVVQHLSNAQAAGALVRCYAPRTSQSLAARRTNGAYRTVNERPNGT